jgi:hypothetical protein
MEEASTNNTYGRLDVRHGKNKIKNSTKSIQKEKD